MIGLGLIACEPGRPPSSGVGQARGDSSGGASVPALTPSSSSVLPTSVVGGRAMSCEGKQLSLLAAIGNAQCGISEDEATLLRQSLEDPAQTPMRVDATVLADGRIRFRIHNLASTSKTYPVFVHSNLDNFTVTTSGKRLAPPSPEWPAGFQFETGRMLRKITLPPQGVAEATLRIDPTVVEQRSGRCPPNAKCPPDTVTTGPLPRGKHLLTIRPPLYCIRSDVEASVEWEY